MKSTIHRRRALISDIEDIGVDTGRGAEASPPLHIKSRGLQYVSAPQHLGNSVT